MNVNGGAGKDVISTSVMPVVGRVCVPLAGSNPSVKSTERSISPKVALPSKGRLGIASRSRIWACTAVMAVVVATAAKSSMRYGIVLNMFLVECKERHRLLAFTIVVQVLACLAFHDALVKLVYKESHLIADGAALALCYV